MDWKALLGVVNGLGRYEVIVDGHFWVKFVVVGYPEELVVVVVEC